MSKRRTAEDALKMTPNVVDFISGGVPSPSDQDEPKRLDKLSTPELNADTTGREATVEPQKKPRKKEISPKQGGARKRLKDDLSPAYSHALAQARIQKSVRFLPQLIAQFQDHCQQELRAGRKSPTLQDALNDALRDWLPKV